MVYIKRQLYILCQNLKSTYDIRDHHFGLIESRKQDVGFFIDRHPSFRFDCLRL